MRRLPYVLSAIAMGYILAAPAIGQRSPTYFINSAGQVVPVTPETPLPVTGGGGGTGAGGDASAANQQTQITVESVIRDRIGDPANPATGTLLGRLGSPFQAGGSVGIIQTTPGTSNGVANYGRTAGTAWVPLAVASDGSLIAPSAGTANRVITKTSVAANTSTTVCPAVTAPVVTEILAVGGGVGIGLNGQTLTQAAIGTAATTPDLPMPAANTLYTMPVASTNALTAYTSTAQIIVCIQTVRQ